jgi:hypothetical protein
MMGRQGTPLCGINSVTKFREAEGGDLKTEGRRDEETKGLRDEET